MESLGDGTDFGDLTDARGYMSSFSNMTRGVFGGGYDPSASNIIDYVTIASTGNATDFGDLDDAQGFGGGCSNAHGGIEVYDPRLIPVGSGIGFFGGGYPSGGGYTNILETIQIPTLGNAVDFGNLSLDRGSFGSMGASHTRILFAGGVAPSPGGQGTNTIDSTEMQSRGNAADFGNLTTTVYGNMGHSSSTRGINGNGFVNPAYSNVIDYVTITTAADAADFGDLTVARHFLSSLSSTTRGVWLGGSAPGMKDEIDYITIGSTGNATDFGDMTDAIEPGGSGASNGIRGLAFGGRSPGVIATIDYITIASTGNASDFGDISTATKEATGMADKTRGIVGGGVTPSIVNVIEYVTIASTGNAADFGDLSATRKKFAATSDAHGGL